MHNQVHPSTAPHSVAEALERLDGAIDDLPKRLHQCARFTRDHLHLIAVSTVSEMAAACEVAPSVYVRFCQALGFSGYTEMQSLFRARFTEFRPDYGKRLATLRRDGAIDTGRLLGDFVGAGHKSLLSLANSVTSDRIERIASGMTTARVVHLVGLRRAFAVVSSLAYTFDQLGVPAVLHHGAGMLNAAAAIFPEDVLFAVTYAPFTDETLRFAEAVHAREVCIYGLSDTDRCPLGEWAREMLIAREDEVGGFRALNASITLTTALAVAIKALREQG